MFFLVMVTLSLHFTCSQPMLEFLRKLGSTRAEDGLATVFSVLALYAGLASWDF